jgi:hypothetical protein
MSDDATPLTAMLVDFRPGKRTAPRLCERHLSGLWESNRSSANSNVSRGGRSPDLS